MVTEQYEIKWKDYYAILGVSLMAEPEVIKAVYTTLARKYHPDAGGNGARMKDINEAYEVLSDRTRKAQYDRLYLQKQGSSGPTGRANYDWGYRHKEGNYSSGWGTGYQTDQRQWQARNESAAKADPNRESILPWLPWKWQRIALLSSFPIALILLFCSDNKIGWLVGSLLLVAAGYASFETRCLSRTRQSNFVAKFAGGFSIILSLCGLVLAAATIAVGLVALAVAAVIVLAFFSAPSSESRGTQGTANKSRHV